MKKNYTSSMCFVIMLLITSILFGQPGNVYYNYDGLWKNATLNDRGVTKAVTIPQSPNTVTMQFLFNPAADDWTAKWCGSNAPNYDRNVNQKYTGGAFYCSGCGWDENLRCPVQTNYYYTFIIGKNASSNNDMSVLETSYNPINIVSVTQSPASNVSSSESVTVTVTLSGTKDANEHVFVRYSTDNWATSSFHEITSFVSNQGTAVISAQAAGTTVSYYALSTIDDTPNATDIDYLTLRLNNNNNSNYSYKVSDIIWCNTQWPQSGTISFGSTYNVYARVYADGITVGAGQGSGIQAWIGYSTTNSNPNTWTNWIPATYYTDNGNNDEYMANIGTAPAGPGTYYYASRFQLGNGAYFYGGYNSNFWDGTTNVSGIMTISDLSWCNLQSPASGTCAAGGTYMAYAQVYAPGLTDAAGQGTGIQSWIGYSTSNTNPNTWTNWVAATYNADNGNNDEYQANIGLPLSPGTYYYASRFQIGNGPYHYGGYNSGEWDGTTSISGTLTVTAAPTVTLQTTSAAAGIVSVDVSMNNFPNVGSLQWSITYDPTYLTFIDGTDCNPTDICTSIYNPSLGKITFVWGDYPGFVSNGKIAQLNFNYTGTGCTDLTWDDVPLSREIADENYQYYTGISWINGQVCPCGSSIWWTGAVNNDWDTPGNWSCYAVPTNTNDVTISSTTNLPVVNTQGTALCRNITIDAGASVTVTTGNNLTIYGNWLNTGSNAVGEGTVLLAGSAAQTINGVTTFENLTLNNPAGANLNGNTEVAGVLTHSQGNLAAGNFLTLLSTASKTALIAGTGTGSVSGNITMQRYMPNKLGYHYYSSPFAAAPISDFTDELGTIISAYPYVGFDTLQTVTPFPNFYLYDETYAQTTISIGWDGASGNLLPMKGYCINFGASGGPLTTDITGTVNSGPLSIPVSYTSSGNAWADGWNLVGNPYPSPIDWEATSGWTKTNVADGIYYFKATSQYYGTYASFVGGYGTNGGTATIPSMQGFFVKATAAGTLGVTNDVRVNAQPTFFKSSGTGYPSLRLTGYQTQSTTKTDETVIYFNPQATNNFDSGFDAYKMMNNDPAYPNLFTSYNGSSSLSINALPPLLNTDVVIPLGYITKTNGSFTINASEILNFDPSQHIYLEDNQTSTIQDLTLNPVYTFTTTANAPQYRFFIRFSPTIVTGVDENSTSFVDAWSAGKVIYVCHSSTTLQKAILSVYDMLGQQVINDELKGSSTFRYTIDKPGCYIVNIVSGSDTFQKKIIIM